MATLACAMRHDQLLNCARALVAGATASAILTLTGASAGSSRVESSPTRGKKMSSVELTHGEYTTHRNQACTGCTRRTVRLDRSLARSLASLARSLARIESQSQGGASLDTRGGQITDLERLHNFAKSRAPVSRNSGSTSWVLHELFGSSVFRSAFLALLRLDWPKWAHAKWGRALNLTVFSPVCDALKRSRSS